MGRVFSLTDVILDIVNLFAPVHKFRRLCLLLEGLNVCRCCVPPDIDLVLRLPHWAGIVLVGRHKIRVERILSVVGKRYNVVLLFDFILRLNCPPLILIRTNLLPIDRQGCF